MVRPRLRGYLVVVAVFVLGVVAGSTSVFAVMKRASTAVLLDDRADERKLEAMTTRLGLDDAQRERIARILAEARRETRAISRQTDARCGHPLLDHRAAVDDRIRAELRGAQVKTFDDLLAQRREREAATPPGAP
jgi:uncharacterized membrane protein